MNYDCTVIGGGIVGLSVAMTLTHRQPGIKLLVLEKEPDFARHQTGRNSGVIHSGIYYKPGSLKARFAREGNRSMVDFCHAHGIRHEVCGKVIVATSPNSTMASTIPTVTTRWPFGFVTCSKRSAPTSRSRPPMESVMSSPATRR